MLTYCISDIHGCYTEFMALLKKINFSENDTLFVLGDIIDRGDSSVECLEYIRTRPNITALMGNHEMMMLDYFSRAKRSKKHDWLVNGGDKTLQQIEQSIADGAPSWNETLKWVCGLPLYVEVTINGQGFFLSHAGFNAMKPLGKQKPHDYIWSREEFIMLPALKDRHCIFGYTPTICLHDSDDCRIWVDWAHNDKTCIDGGCVYGGVLTAFRLDDGKAFYVGNEKFCSTTTAA